MSRDLWAACCPHCECPPDQREGHDDTCRYGCNDTPDKETPVPFNTMALNYRKKPVVIQAMRLTGNNAHDLADWVGEQGTVKWVGSGVPAVLIKTLEGTMQADVGDYIIKGVQGEFYPCKPDIFEATYDAA
jgi:hypothetical protein